MPLLLPCRVVLRLFLGLVVVCVSGKLHAQIPRQAQVLTQALDKAPTDATRIPILIRLADAYRGLDVSEQFSYASTALNLATQTADRPGEMEAQEALGNCYIQVLNYQEALIHLKKAFALAIQLRDTGMLHQCLQQVAQSYQALNQLPLAAFYQRQLVYLAAHRTDPLDLYRQRRSYARIRAAQGQYSEAIQYLQHTIGLVAAAFNGAQRDALEADLYNLIATLYNTVYDKDSTLRALNQASLLIAHTDSATTAAYIISTYCDVYYTHRQYDSAIYYGEETIHRARAIRNLDMQRYYSGLLSKIYTKSGLPEQALAYHLQADSLTDVQFNTPKAFAEGHELMKLNMEQQAALTTLEKQASETTRRHQWILLVMAGAIVLALSVLTLISYRNLRQNQRSTRIIRKQAEALRRQNQVTAEALQANELMLQETHHRIKNNLQLISSLLELQAAGLSDEVTQAALRTAQRRIQSIATVHSKLYGSGAAEAVELRTFTRDLFAQLRQAFGDAGGDVAFENALPELSLPLPTVVVLGLILNELFTNAFKHAFTMVAGPWLSIALQKEGGRYVLMYRDNGPGLPSGIFEDRSGTLGLYLIRRMAVQLGGTVAYTFENGAIFTLVFPEDAGK